MTIILSPCPSDENDKGLLDKILDFKLDELDQDIFIPPEIIQAIHQLWKDPIINKILEDHSGEFYLMDSAV